MNGSLVDNDQNTCMLGGYKFNSDAGALLEDIVISEKKKSAVNIKAQKCLKKSLLQNNLGVLEREKNKIKQDHEEYK